MEKNHVGDVEHRKLRISVYSEDIVKAVRDHADDEGRVVLYENYSLIPKYVAMYSEAGGGVSIRSLPIGSKVRFDWVQWTIHIPVHENGGHVMPTVWWESDTNGNHDGYAIISDELIRRDVSPEFYQTDLDITDKMCYWMRGLITDYKWAPPAFNEFKQIVTNSNIYEDAGKYTKGLLPKIVEQRVGKYDDDKLVGLLETLSGKIVNRDITNMGVIIGRMLVELGVFANMYGITAGDVNAALSKIREKNGLPAIDD